MSPLDRNYIRGLIAEKMTNRRRRIGILFLAVISVVFFVGAFYVVSLTPPAGFPVRTVVTIREKAGLNEIAKELRNFKVIRSEFWFRIAVIMIAGDRGVLAGDYFFVKPVGVFGVTSRVTKGNF